MIFLAHGVRLAIDLMLFGLLLELDVYEFPTSIIALIISRIIVGHGGRVLQYIFGFGSVWDGFIVGLFANGIKTFLESVILFSLYEDEIPGIVALVIVIGILGRNGFESLSLCEDFSD